MDRIKFLTRILGTRVSPLSYLTAFVSWAIGFFFLFLGSLTDVQQNLLYEYGVFGQAKVWGGLLLALSTVLLVGLYKKNRGLCRIGAMANFVLWSFAAGMYISHKFWYAFFTIALFHMICQAYFYLAASIDSVWQIRVEYNRSLGA